MFSLKVAKSASFLSHCEFGPAITRAKTGSPEIKATWYHFRKGNSVNFDRVAFPETVSSILRPYVPTEKGSALDLS